MNSDPLELAFTHTAIASDLFFGISPCDLAGASPSPSPSNR